MLKLTLQYGQAYVTVTAAFVLCSPFVLTGERGGTNREHGGQVGVAAPPAIGQRPDTDAPLHLTDIPKIPLKPLAIIPLLCYMPASRGCLCILCSLR